MPSCVGAQGWVQNFSVLQRTETTPLQIECVWQLVCVRLVSIQRTRRASVRHEKEIFSNISPQFPFLREFRRACLKANGVLIAPSFRQCQPLNATGRVATSSLCPVNLYGSQNWGSMERSGWTFADRTAGMTSSCWEPSFLACLCNARAFARCTCLQQSWGGLQDLLGATWHFRGVSTALSSYVVAPWDRSGALGQLLHCYVCLTLGSRPSRTENDFSFIGGSRSKALECLIFH